MKILWLSNAILSDLDSGATGNWLGSMARSLVATGEIELCNIAMGAVKAQTRQNNGQIQQWIEPISKLGRDGLPPAHIVAKVLKAIEEFNPDLVHVWGVENYWGLLITRGHIARPTLLEMQGIKGAIAKKYAGGLTRQDQRNCIGFKEIIKRRSIASESKKYEEWGRIEDEIMAGFRVIVAQTPWVGAQVRAVNSSCQILHNDLMLRREFYDAAPWAFPEKGPILFCSAAYPAPFKGLHDAIRAVALVTRLFPNVRLRIAGTQQKPGLRQDGYVRWLNKLCLKVGVAGQVDWLGPINADQIVLELQRANVFIMPSHIENCSTSMQEAMMIGTPIVASYAGGLPSLAIDEESALFYPSGDEAMCARQLERILTEQELAEKLSHNARAIALVRNNPETIVKNQLEIYRQVITATVGTHS